MKFWEARENEFWASTTFAFFTAFVCKYSWHDCHLELFHPKLPDSSNSNVFLS